MQQFPFLLLFLFTSFGNIANAQLQVSAERYFITVDNSYNHSISFKIKEGHEEIPVVRFLDFQAKGYKFCGNYNKSQLKKLNIIPFYNENNYLKDSERNEIQFQKILQNIEKNTKLDQDDNLVKLGLYSAAVASANASSTSNSMLAKSIGFLSDLGIGITDTYLKIEDSFGAINDLDNLIYSSSDLNSLVNNIVPKIGEYLIEKEANLAIIKALEQLPKELKLKSNYSQKLANHVVYRIKNHILISNNKIKAEEYYKNEFNKRKKYLKSIINNDDFSKKGTINVFNALSKENVNGLKTITPNFEIQIFPFLISSNLNNYWDKRSDPLLVKGVSDDFEFGDGIINGSFGGELNFALGKEIIHKRESCIPKIISRFYFNISYLRRDYNAVDSLLTSIHKGLTVKQFDGTLPIQYAGEIVFNHVNIGAGLKYRLYTGSVYFEVGSSVTQQIGILDFTKSEIQTQGVKWAFEKVNLNDKKYQPVYNLGFGINGKKLGLCVSSQVYKSNLENLTAYTISSTNEKINYSSKGFLWNVGIGLKFNIL